MNEFLRNEFPTGTDEFLQASLSATTRQVGTDEVLDGRRTEVEGRRAGRRKTEDGGTTTEAKKIRRSED